MGTYDRQIATARRLIAAKGRAVSWAQSNPGAPADPNKPWDLTQGTDTLTAVTIVFLPYDALHGRATSVGRGDAAEVNEAYSYGLMADTPGLVPKKGDSVIFDTVNNPLAVEAVDRLAPDGNSILYSVRFKGKCP